ncbi:MAG: class I SAM-dependent methyltransferase [Proteobacteria bacterium]|uniref:class I SAM-dependent methyltransferase n=1 Tax=Rudaea sp. TaxID=2136325 RepID=UPI00321F8F0F|nr:class I SAM-dependent methyltransferase [Pseudomonadota bacterium]
MTDFKDHFSGHADLYREARPTYPDALFDWLAGQAPDRALAWDCGCGNGQASVALARRFERVVASDPSANQIADAAPRANIDYRVEPAEHSSLAAASASLVTVAQALHWFDFAAFYAEVKRVLRPGGVVAAWSYAACNVDPAVDGVIEHLYGDALTGPYWPPERAHIDAGYRTIPFPFAAVAAPEFAMVARWNVAQLLAYLRSWSATQRYIAANGIDPVRLVEADLRTAWGDAARVRDVQWRFHLRVGRV